VNTTLITTVDSFASIREEWEALAARGCTPMLDHDWLMAWASTRREQAPLRIVIVREHGRLLAAAPLVLDRLRRRLALMGATDLFEPGNWLFTSAESLDALSDAVIGLGEPFVLERIPRGGAVADSIYRRARIRALTLTRPTGASHVVPTSDSWITFVNRLSSRTRRQFERASEGLEKAVGDFRLITTSPAPADVPRLIETLSTLEHDGWKGRAGSSLSRRPELARFFHEYCTRLAHRHQLRVTSLVAGRSTVAIEIAVEAYGRKWGLKIAYAEPLGVHAPGLQVVLASIKDTYDRGLDAYEFNGAAESWQRRWRPIRRDYTMVALYPVNLAGATRALSDLVSVLAGRLQRRNTR
jgi:CelD/BcsL family acetyltransferase involved in cellulose biosynthesis